MPDPSTPPVSPDDGAPSSPASPAMPDVWPRGRPIWYVMAADHRVDPAIYEDWLAWQSDDCDAKVSGAAPHTPGRVAWHEWQHDDGTRTQVSTVFIGIDTNIDGPPAVFETMCFGGRADQEQLRAATWDEAVATHHDLVAIYRADLGRDADVAIGPAAPPASAPDPDDLARAHDRVRARRTPRKEDR
jgi:hypothetical protein